ncbi:patatin-like phospholipase [Penicillium cf. viridicatum]|uniref:Patatin-like phospholipase n=1 Tax=Penicillium cf. viridicatum TaxID=2972119 RepID=A0A9W9M8X3_9EURO|nr:patatin-like phospholipase [Penicillium cf. viridicatum]
MSLNSTRPILFADGDARLVFLFTNVIYIFGDDVDSLSGVVDFLHHPSLLLFAHEFSSGDKSLSELFSGINFVYLDESLSPTARFERLRAFIKG